MNLLLAMALRHPPPLLRCTQLKVALRSRRRTNVFARGAQQERHVATLASAPRKHATLAMDALAMKRRQQVLVTTSASTMVSSRSIIAAEVNLMQLHDVSPWGS